MRTKITQTFNGRCELPVVGKYLEILSVVNGVDVELIDRFGQVIESASNVGAGSFFDRRGAVIDEFARIAITTGASEEFSILVTDGFSGNRSVPSSVQSTVPAVGVAYAPAKKTVTNASGTLLAANSSRKYLLVQNQGSGDIYVDPDGGTAAADAGSVKIAAGGYWEPLVPPVGALTAIGSIASNPDVHVSEG